MTKRIMGMGGPALKCILILQVAVLNLTCGFSALDFDDEGEEEILFHKLKKRTTEVEEPDYPISEYLENCAMTHVIVNTKPFKFITPYYGASQYPPDVNCSWNFVGTSSCSPRLSCSEFDLRPNNDCAEEYLEISDGFGGRERFCGKNNLSSSHRLKASRNGRDLFVKLRTMNRPKFSRTFKGFKCQVECGGGGGDKRRDKALTPAPNGLKLESRCFCGYQNKDDRIVNGEDGKMNEFPWLVAIVNKGSRSPFCGGSIINDRYILTAAHCFSLSKIRAVDIQVLVHAHTLDLALNTDWVDADLGVKGSIRGPGYNLSTVTDEDEQTERFNVVEMTSHPLFTAKFDYDVAVLKLDKALKLNEANAPIPICLPQPGDYKKTYEGRTAIVAGWGMPHQDAGSTTRLLQKLHVPIIRRNKCQDWNNQAFTETMMCAGYEEGGKDACMGDSGGPLILSDEKKSKRWTQIGIVSWGEGCARRNKPGLYSVVSELNQWIRYQASLGGAKWCQE